MFSPGSRIDAYVLVGLLGEGGMAQVWTARRRGAHGFEKLVAMKVIHSRLAEEPRFRAMFLDEARITAAIHHPNVAQVFDLGERDDLLYLVMEYVDGDSLAALITTETGDRKTVPVDVALRITRDVCAGLEAAHNLTDADGRPRSVVHRDVSPQNVLVGLRGEVKVIDFGIALARDRLAGETVDGSVKGKLQYMPPEQVRHKPLGPTADVFATGAMLYSMLVGRAPFAGENEAATLQRLLAGTPPEMPESLPEHVREVITKAIAFEPSDRYASAAEMMRAIEEAERALGLRADVPAWVDVNLSPKARTRRAELARRAEAPSVPDLGFDLGGPSPSTAATKPPPRPANGWGRDVTASVGDPGPPAATFELDHSVKHDPRPPVPVAARVPEPLAPMDATLRLSGGALAQMAAPAPATPAPPAEPEAKGDEFFDVGALRARAQSQAGPDAPSPAGTTSPAARRGGPRPPREAAPATKARGGSGRVVFGIAIAVLLVALVGAAYAFAPSYVRKRVVAEAQAAGVTLEIDAVSLSPSGVTLRGVEARSVDVPGAVLRAQEIRTRGFSAADVEVDDVNVAVTGSAEDVLRGVTQLVARVERGIAIDARAASSTRRATVHRARLAWPNALGDGSSIDADGASLELEDRPRDPSEKRRLAAAQPTAAPPAPVSLPPRVLVGKATAPRVLVRTSRGTLGPWSTSVDADGTSTRVRLLFDPAVPDGPSALWIGTTGAVGQLTVKIPRVPLATLGIPGEVVGLAKGASPDVALQIESGLGRTGRIEAKGRLDVFGVQIPGGRAATDLRVEGQAAGVPGRPLTLEGTTATVGPFTADVAGELELGFGGVRLDATWKVGPIPCERFARREAANLGPLALALQDLGQVTGIARVTGTAQANGTLRVDPSAAEPVALSAKTKDTCGLSLFGW